jgi:hypothetical protein
MLLLDCQDSCPECLDQPNRYADWLKPSRALTRCFVGVGGIDVVADEHPDDWPQRVRSALRERGAVRLQSGPKLSPAVLAWLPGFLVDEIEVDYLLLPVRLRRVDRIGADLLLSLELRDVLHV